jgi:group I intron endonuclease
MNRTLVMDNISGIYCIRNKVNNKMYIGSSVSIRKRVRRHINSLINNKHDNEHLQNAWIKYGKESFEFIILACVLIKEQLRNIEKYFIDLYQVCNRDFGYNKSITTTHGTLTEEGRQRQIKLQTGRKWSSEINKKKSLPGILNPFYGKTHKYETKLKIAKTRGLESFVCVETGDVFNFMTEAVSQLNVSEHSLHNCLNGRNYVANGLHFICLSKIPFEYEVIDNKIIFSLEEKAKLISIIDPRRKLFICLETNELFSSVNKAAKVCNTNRSSISKNLKNLQSCAGTYHFKYI